MQNEKQTHAPSYDAATGGAPLQSPMSTGTHGGYQVPQEVPAYTHSPPPHDAAYSPPPPQMAHTTDPYNVAPTAIQPDSVPGGQQPLTYKTATPLNNLQDGPAPVDCPACGARAMTHTNHESGNTTHHDLPRAWAAGLCLLTCLCCIPYCISATKDVQHNCGKCGARLATWHRSGRTEVLQRHWHDEYAQPQAVVDKKSIRKIETHEWKERMIEEGRQRKITNVKRRNRRRKQRNGGHPYHSPMMGDVSTMGMGGGGAGMGQRF